jgi:phosphotriesterase-related protein
MRTINTIKGQITSGETEMICVHEHLFIDMTHEAVQPEPESAKLFYGRVKMQNIGLLRRNPYVVRTNLVLDNVRMAAREAAFAQNEGVNLLLDLTSVGLGRDVMKLKKVSGRTHLNIVAGCGLFTHDAIPSMYSDWSVERIAEWMIAEITTGIGNTGIKPGVIGEIGTSEKIYPVEERSLKAAAIAGVHTGLPVYIHTYPWSRAGLDAVDIVLEGGVPGKDICVCHLDVTFDYEYILMMLKKGVYVEFDNFGKEFYFESQNGAFAGGPFETDLARVRMLKRLIDGGYAGQLLIANDLCLKSMLHAYGGWGYDHVFRNIVPMMRMEGIGEQEIRTVLVDNPKRFLFDTVQ